jgi:hypothetical protein
MEESRQMRESLASFYEEIFPHISLCPAKLPSSCFGLIKKWKDDFIWDLYPPFTQDFTCIFCREDNFQPHSRSWPLPTRRAIQKCFHFFAKYWRRKSIWHGKFANIIVSSGFFANISWTFSRKENLKYFSLFTTILQGIKKMNFLKKGKDHLLALPPSDGSLGHGCLRGCGTPATPPRNPPTHPLPAGIRLRPWGTGHIFMGTFLYRIFRSRFCFFLHGHFFTTDQAGPWKNKNNLPQVENPSVFKVQ